VKPGSIYNALKTLTRDGYLEVVGTDQVGGRPERTTYRLTAAGEEEFRILLREEWWTVRPPIDPLMAALSFIGFVTRNEAIAALEHRTAQIHGFVRHLEFATEALDGVDSPYHVREMHRLMNARISAEVAWAEQFIARLRNGEYATADDPPWQPASALPKPPASALPKPPASSSRPRAGKPKAAPQGPASRAAPPAERAAPPAERAAPPAERASPAAERASPAAAERTAGRRDRERKRQPSMQTRGTERSTGARSPRSRGSRRRPAP
jgi:hypothetical protein